MTPGCDSSEQGRQAVDPPALIVAGPTCSGKSALAIWLAQRVVGTVINADSMQVYRELRVVTARPTAADEALVPHALYGVRPAADAGSVAWWRAAALAEMAQAANRGRVPILCGGTGMYIAALTDPPADIPTPDPVARSEARRLLAELGAPRLHQRLGDADPETAAILHPADSQRIARAWEVWRSTGLGLAAWQRAPGPPTAPWRFAAVLLDPPRHHLRHAIATRFDDMLARGALGEVEDLLALGLDPALPAMRAHGVPELSAVLHGEIALDEARRRATLATGQYTKRQATWFRHRLPLAPARVHTIHARYAGLEQFSENERSNFITFVHAAVDAPR
jgi:tRNA dimethylallyltransferase